MPCARLGDVATPDLQARHEKLVASLKRANVPIVGFVNEKKLEVDGKVQPQRVAMLRDWLDAGFDLGNPRIRTPACTRSASTPASSRRSGLRPRRAGREGKGASAAQSLPRT